MAKKDKFAKVGVWSFVVGLIVAIIVSVFSAQAPATWTFALLGVLGLIVGLLNVSKKETLGFLVASIAFLISFQSLAMSLNVVTLGFATKTIATFFSLLSVFVAPAAAVVAVISLYHISKD